MLWRKFNLAMAAAVLVAAAPAILADGLYAAQSHCSVTGATGYGAGRSKEQAVASAIESCIDAGGIPKCCAHGASDAYYGYRATSYCSATGKSGEGVARRQDDANELAISDCIQNGGIPHCCRSGLRY